MTQISPSFIPNRLKNASSEHPYVAGAIDIIDDEKEKSQEQINQETDDTLAIHQSEINALDSQNFASFTAESGDTLADILPAQGAVDTIYRVGFWDGSANSGAGGVDATVYSEYAWDAANSVYKLLDVKTAIGEVFDISLYHASGGVLAKYADLAAALGTNGANVPETLRKGGMSVKFVSSVDNKYVQYRLMDDEWSTTVSEWQGVDDEPTAGSNNLVKSGGVYSKIHELDIEVFGVQTTRDGDVHQVFPSSAEESSEGTRLRIVFPVNKGATISASCSAGKGLSVDIYATVLQCLYNGNEDVLQSFTNRQYASSTSGTSNYDGYLVVSLCKNDSSAFSAQDKADFIAATNVLIENKSLPDKIDDLHEEIIEDIEGIGERILNGSFVGNNAHYSSQQIFGLIPGHTYRIYFKNPGWAIPTLSSGEVVFGIRNSYNNVLSYIINVAIPTISVEKYYDFEISENSDFIDVGGCANLGTIVSWCITDITDTKEVGINYKSINDALYALRKVTSNGETTDQAEGTRLRIIYYVPKGAKLDIGTNDESGIYVSLQPTLYNAIYGNAPIETYTDGTYKASATGITSSIGFLLISMTNGNTAITDARKAEMLASLYVSITYGVKGKEPDISSANFLNEDMNDALVSVGGINAFASGSYSSFTTKKKNLSILAISDIHGTFDSIHRAIDYANAKPEFIDYVTCLGDVVLRSPADSVTDFESSFANSFKPFLFTVGNHDTADTGLAGITEAQARAKYFSQIEAKGWLSNFKDANSCSWYKDDSNYKIRLISVFEYGNSETIATGAPNTYCRRWIPTETLQWFADTLYSTPSDYSVVVLLHQIPFFPATYVDGKFTISSDMRISLSQFFLNTVDGNPFGDVVNAFISGNNLSQTYNSIASYGLSKTATVAKDFTGRGAGKFICFVVGHFHGSYIFKDATYTNQITVAVPSGSQSAFQQKYGDTNYAPNTRNEDQFYVIGFDTENQMINIAKIGGQVTNDMVKRDIISVKY